jgi:hypothetical protein
MTDEGKEEGRQSTPEHVRDHDERRCSMCSSTAQPRRSIARLIAAYT